MKKSFISLGLITATILSLTNCTKEIENPAQEPESAGVPFEIVASTPDTKTINDGLVTNWKANDEISVFHALTGTGEYVSDGPFTITSENLSDKKFTGTIGGDGLDGESSYDWYVMYPYKSAWKPNTTNGGVVYMGSKHNEVQTQNGNGSKAHLAGGNVPFAGKAINVAASADVDITMEHLAAVLEIIVNNTSGEPLTVSSVRFTAPEPIIGGYYISIVGAKPVYTPNGIYVNNTATLTVKNADAIASGSSAIFYLAVKPFNAASNSVLRISVNGISKELTLTKDVLFKPGYIKSMTFTYDKKIQILSFSSNSAEAVIGSAFERPTLTGSQTAVTYKSSNEAVATVNASTGEVTLKSAGETDITATAEETLEYWSASASYTLTVHDQVLQKYTLTSVDIKNVNAKWAYADTDTKSINAADGSEWSCYKCYRGSDNQATVQFKATADIGYLMTPTTLSKIKKVDVTVRGGSNSAILKIDSIVSGELFSQQVSNSMEKYTFNLTGDDKQLKFRSGNGTLYIDSVVVYY